MLRKPFESFSRYHRERRAMVLLEHIKPEPDWCILDLGGSTGDHIHSIFPNHSNIIISDFSAPALATARERFGYATIEADGSDQLPFANNQFDLVFCSSVIEHVTGPKNQIIRMTDDQAFQRMAFHFQKRFAAEIRRIGKRYYVQTPHRYFLIESHTWLPMPIVFLPRSLQIRIIAFFNRFWPKQTQPDWNLLIPSQKQQLFPDATIFVERSGGMPKSIMAIKA